MVDFAAIGLCRGGSDERTEFFENIVDGFDQFGAVAEQAMAAVRHAAGNGAGNREDFTTLLGSVACGDEGAGTERRFDDNDAQREAADDAVALREHAGQRLETGGRFADDRAVGGDLIGELLVFGGINIEHAAGQDRDGAAASGESAAVCRGVDAASEPADDGEAGASKTGGESFGLG